jgi:hypothetical protein
MGDYKGELISKIVFHALKENPSPTRKEDFNN